MNNSKSSQKNNNGKCDIKINNEYDDCIEEC